MRKMVETYKQTGENEPELQSIKYYSGAYEKEIKGATTTEWTYIYGATGLAAVYRQVNGTGTMYYALTDHLGSITGLVDANGQIAEEYSYDAWGRRRDPVNWTTVYNNSTNQQFNNSLISRGYTGHEHHEAFCLINMNGRLYDPILGRVLSPDNFVQNPDFSQGFNRYSYCGNNPLIYTDPDGELFWIIPNISWSKKGGFSIGITFMVGIPGIAILQVGGGYNFKSQDYYVSFGGTAMLNTLSVSYSPSSQFTIGYSIGFSPETGLPIGTNFLTIGTNYNTKYGYSSNISAWSINESGDWSFNPSLNVSYDISEPVNNLAKGQGFRTNRSVFDRMNKGDYTCDEIIKYFGFEGKYKPYRDNIGGANTNSITADIEYTDDTFKSYNYLLAYALHEEFHRNEVLSGKIDKTKFLWYEKAEYRASLYNYKNQWRCLQAKDITFKLNVSQWAIRADVTPDLNSWDFIYKIPRRF